MPDPTKPDGADITRCLLIDPDTAAVTFSTIMTPQPAAVPARAFGEARPTPLAHQRDVHRGVHLLAAMHV